MNKRTQKYVKGIIYIAVGISGAWLLILYIKDNSLSIKTIFSAIGTITTIVSVFWFIYNNYLWKTKIAFWEHTPVLLKEYEGYLYSNYNKATTPIDIKLEVKQSLLSISFKMMTSESRSSTVVSNIVEENNNWEVYYTYRNEPNSTYSDRSAMHYGTVKLDINNPDSISGNYWTGRESSGELHLVPVGNKDSITPKITTTGGFHKIR